MGEVRLGLYTVRNVERYGALRAAISSYLCRHVGRGGPFQFNESMNIETLTVGAISGRKSS